jgi:iron complex outermembrane recepter protein
MLSRTILIRIAAFYLCLYTGISTQGQNILDTIVKPVYKLLDSVEVGPRGNTGYIKSISSFATKTSTPVMDIPLTISTDTRQLMDDKMDFSLKESVTDLANVNAYSGYDEYSIRGFLAENPRCINGLRGYNSKYTSILLLNIDNVEVLKGPAAVLYGNTDPGGTVNLVTKKPQSVPSAQIALIGGSWDHFRATGDFTGPLNDSNTISYRLNAGYDQTSGFTDQFYSKAYQIAPSFLFTPLKNLQVSLDFSYSQVNTMLNRGQPGLEFGNDLYATPVNLTVSQPGDFLREKDLSSMISVDWRIKPRLTFHTAYLNYLTWQNVAEHGLDSYIDDDSVNLYFQKWNYQAITNSWTNYFNYTFPVGETKHELLIGYDYITSGGPIQQSRYENPDIFGKGSGIVGTFNLLYPQYNQEPANNYQLSSQVSGDLSIDHYTTQGIYLQDQISYKGFDILLGIRREFYRSDPNDQGDSSATVENVWLPRIGLVYAVTPKIHVYGLYCQGFDPYESPNTPAVYLEPFKPINSELFEVGLKTMLLKGKLYGTLSLYQLSIYHVSVNANDPANPDLYVQRGEDQARGMELELNGNILPNLQFHLAYAYNVARVKESVLQQEIGTIKENAPLNSGNGFFKYDWLRGLLKNFSLLAGYTQVGRRNTLDKNLQLPGYFTVQAGMNYRWKPLLVSFLLNNIGNAEYWSGAYNNVYKWPGAGRNFLIKLNWDLPITHSAG